MSTRALVGIKQDGEPVRYIYNHFDGGIKSLGTQLYKCFNSADAVSALIDRGDASSIIDDVFYAEEHGEELMVGYTSTVEEYFTDTPGIDYVYLFDQDGTWLVSCYGARPTKVVDSL